MYVDEIVSGIVLSETTPGEMVVPQADGTFKVDPQHPALQRGTYKVIRIGQGPNAGFQIRNLLTGAIEGTATTSSDARRFVTDLIDAKRGQLQMTGSTDPITVTKDTPNTDQKPGRSGTRQKIDVESFDEKTGKIKGTLPDGTKVEGKMPELRSKLPGYEAKKTGIIKKITKVAIGTSWYGGIMAVLGALNIATIYWDANTKIGELKADMSYLRFSNKEMRQQYYEGQLDQINSSAHAQAVTTIAASLAGAIAAAKAGKGVSKLVSGMAMVARFAGPMGFIAGIAVMILVEGLIWLGSWWVRNHGEEFAAGIWDSMWGGLLTAADTAVDVGVDAWQGAGEMRGNISTDMTGAEEALAKDERDDNSGNPSDEAKAIIRGSDSTGQGWLD